MVLHFNLTAKDLLLRVLMPLTCTKVFVIDDGTKIPAEELVVDINKRYGTNRVWAVISTHPDPGHTLGYVRDGRARFPRNPKTNRALHVRSRLRRQCLSSLPVNHSLPIATILVFDD